MTDTIEKPTAERVRQGNIEVSGLGKRFRERDPLRIDKLLRAGTIDNMQHFTSLQFYTLWIGAQRPGIKSHLANVTRIPNSRETALLARMDMQDQYFWLISHLDTIQYQMLHNVICEEIPAIDAARLVGIDRDRATTFLRDCLDTLDGLFVAMRDAD